MTNKRRITLDKIGSNPFAIFGESLLDVLSQQNESSFPYFNIINKSKTHSVLQVALAGYTADDVNVTVEKNILNISSHDGASAIKFPDTTKGERYQHNGISNKLFSRQFVLNEHTEVKDAHMADGVLTIYLETTQPENAKAKVIPVSKETPKREMLFS